jgi:hypothetical protein
MRRSARAAGTVIALTIVTGSCSTATHHASRATTSTLPATTTTQTPAPTAGPEPAPETVDRSFKTSVYTGRGTHFAPPPAAETRAIGGAGCAVLVDAGWTLAGCGQATTRLGAVVWLTEFLRSEQTPPTWRATVWRPSGDGRWTASLAEIDPGGLFGPISARVADVEGTGRQEVVFLTEGSGSGGALIVDVVNAPRSVSFHAEGYDTGVAKLGSSRIDVWGRTTNDLNVPHAGWSQFVHDVFRYSGGQWRRTSSGHGTGPLPYGHGYVRGAGDSGGG